MKKVLPQVIFFFQAEDGIRYCHVTGVQTCALPISTAEDVDRFLEVLPHAVDKLRRVQRRSRSEERRVGKECRSRWSAYHYKKNSRSTPCCRRITTSPTPCAWSPRTPRRT